MNEHVRKLVEREIGRCSIEIWNLEPKREEFWSKLDDILGEIDSLKDRRDLLNAALKESDG